MTAPTRSRSWLPGSRRPPWQQRLPNRLRVAAEWQFGTPIALALVCLIRGVLPGAAVFLFLGGFWYLFLTGWHEGKMITNRLIWWPTVLFLSVIQGGIALILLLDPPS